MPDVREPHIPILPGTGRKGVSLFQLLPDFRPEGKIPFKNNRSKSPSNPGIQADESSGREGDLVPPPWFSRPMGRPPRQGVCPPGALFLLSSENRPLEWRDPLSRGFLSVLPRGRNRLVRLLRFVLFSHVVEKKKGPSGISPPGRTNRKALNRKGISEQYRIRMENRKFP